MDTMTSPLAQQIAALAPAGSVHRTNPVNTFPGVFLGLSLPLPMARRVAAPGGSPPEELHVTLVYLGRLDTYGAADLPRFQALLHQLPELSDTHLPLKGTFAGSGRFTQAKKDVAYLGIDAPGLERLQLALADAARAASLSPSTDHGFTPHLTLAYLTPEQPHPCERPPGDEFTFATLELWLAGTRVMVLPDASGTLAKAEGGDAAPDLNQQGRDELAQLIAESHVLNAQDLHVQQLSGHLVQLHQSRFAGLTAAMRGPFGSPLEAAAIHQADEAARARRVSDL